MIIINQTKCIPPFVILVWLVTTSKGQWLVDDHGCITPGGGSGSCIPIQDCKHVSDIIQNSDPLSQNANDEVQSYHCGVIENSIKVCCPINVSTKPTIIVKLPTIIELPADDACITPNSDVGTCISLNECKHMTDFIQNNSPLSRNAIDLIKRFQCGAIANSVSVCCPKNPIVLQTVTTTTKPPKEECRTPDENIGTCIPINECKPITDFIQKFSPLPPNAIKMITGYQCGPVTNIVSVCCPKNSIVPETIISNQILTTTPEPPKDECRTPDKNLGSCIPIKECKHITNFIQNSWPLSQNSIEILKSYECISVTNSVNVCCPNNPIVIETVTMKSPLITAQPPNDGCITPDNKMGFCTPIKNCKRIIDFIKKYSPLSQKATELLQDYQCGVNTNTLNVCCPNSPIIMETMNIETPNTIAQPPDVTNHQNLKLLPEECGLQFSASRIIGGNKTALAEFPWMALLSYETGKGLSFRCGGTIINEWYILTAAHCITPHPTLKLVGVRVGEHNISTERDCEKQPFGDEYCTPPVQDIAIGEVIPHQKYNPKSYINDIGLIRLASPIDTSVETAKPICLPITVELRNKNFTNENLTVTGWGNTETGQRSEDMLKVNIPVLTEETCRTAYNNTSAVISVKQICAGGRNKSDSCTGDSGGPLQTLLVHNDDIRCVQFGIVSFGPRFCGQEGFPGVYTKVDHYMDWILDNMKP